MCQTSIRYWHLKRTQQTQTLRMALPCFALLCFALLCFALLCFALLCFAWRGVAWRGVAWRGVAWRGVAWRGVAWRGVAWRGVAWRGVAWRGVAWRGVAWRGVPGYLLTPEEKCKRYIVTCMKSNGHLLTMIVATFSCAETSYHLNNYDHNKRVRK